MSQTGDGYPGQFWDSRRLWYNRFYKFSVLLA
jgi:hypothetical protein